MQERETLFSRELYDRAAEVLDRCRSRAVKLVTAESCTGGLVAGLLTEVPGSSDVVERGFVTYSNDAKQEQIGVPAELIATHGAVSKPVARAMAEGALRHSRAQISVAVTGVAGPGGGTDRKPVGLVHFATAFEGRTESFERRFGDLGRSGVRRAAVACALELLFARLG